MRWMAAAALALLTTASFASIAEGRMECAPARFVPNTCVGDVRNDPGCGLRFTGVYANPHPEVYADAGGYTACGTTGTSSGVRALWSTPVSTGGASWARQSNGSCAIIVSVIVPPLTGQHDIRECPAGQAPPDPGWGHLLP